MAGRRQLTRRSPAQPSHRQQNHAGLCYNRSQWNLVYKETVRSTLLSLVSSSNRGREMCRTNLLARRARIRVPSLRAHRRCRFHRRRVRFAIPQIHPVGHGGGSADPGPINSPAHGLTAAAQCLHEALARLDPLVLRQVGLREESHADVHEAIGLIVECLSLLDKAHRRVDSGSGRAIGILRGCGMRLV